VISEIYSSWRFEMYDEDDLKSLWRESWRWG